MRKQTFWKNFFRYLADILTEAEKEKVFEEWRNRRMKVRRTIRKDNLSGYPS